LVVAMVVPEYLTTLFALVHRGQVLG